MAFHTVKHHQSYKSNNCTSPLMRNLFPDSNISKKHSCVRTVKYVLNDIQEHGIMYLGVATDSSNHQSTKLSYCGSLFQLETWGPSVKVA